MTAIPLARHWRLIYQIWVLPSGSPISFWRLRADTNLDSNLLGCPPRWNGQRLLKSMESDVFILPDAGLTAVVYSGKHAYISCQVPTTAYHTQSSRTRWRANMYLYEVYQSRMWNDNCWISAEIRISIACCFYLPLFALFLES